MKYLVKISFLVIMVLFFSCTYEPVKPILEGTYYTEGLEITFKSGKIAGNTICNDLTGQYELIGNKINIDLRSTKVYHEGEFDIELLRGAEYYEINSNKLILIGKNYKLSLYIKK